VARNRKVEILVQWRTKDKCGQEVWNLSGYVPKDMDDAKRHAAVQADTFSNVRILVVTTEEEVIIWPAP
jgi:hypothetical protein